MRVLVKSSGLTAAYVAGVWEIGIARVGSITVSGNQVVSTRSAAIASPSGGSTIDANARIAIDAILGALRHHGLIAP